MEVRIIGLVILSCFLQAINTLDDLPLGVHRGINAIDDVCVYIFAVEFFLRWWSAGRFQLRYLAKPLASIDAVSLVCVLFVNDHAFSSPHSTLHKRSVPDCCNFAIGSEWTVATMGIFCNDRGVPSREHPCVVISIFCQFRFRPVEPAFVANIEVPARLDR